MRHLLLLLLVHAGSARAEGPTVVTDLAVTQSMVAAVMGDRGAPVALVEAAGDPHHIQLRPSQMRSLAEADLVVWTGPALTPWLDQVIGGLGTGVQVLTLQEPAEAAEDVDSHAWLDPSKGREWLGRIARELADMDRQHADIYMANAARARQAVEAAAAEAAALLAPVRLQPIVVQHDAYRAYARAFGLTVAGALADQEGAAPGARRAADLREAIARQGVACLFAEPTHADRAIRRLSEDTGVPVGHLDPTGALLPPGPDLYPGVIVGLARAIVDCVR